MNLPELKNFTDDTRSHQEFGYAISVSGNYLAASTVADDNGMNAGAVYLYENKASGWQQVQKLQGDDSDTDDLFGRSVSLNNNRLAIVAIGAADSGSNGGQTYV